METVTLGNDVNIEIIAALKNLCGIQRINNGYEYRKFINAFLEVKSKDTLEYPILNDYFNIMDIKSDANGRVYGVYKADPVIWSKPEFKKEADFLKAFKLYFDEEKNRDFIIVKLYRKALKNRISKHGYSLDEYIKSKVYNNKKSNEVDSSTSISLIETFITKEKNWLQVKFPYSNTNDIRFRAIPLYDKSYDLKAVAYPIWDKKETSKQITELLEAL